jgi:general secretion pathway protein A
MPFSITPDPTYLYMSARHQEALGHLLYGTGQYGGFVQLTGEVGTGKTTIIRTLLSQKMPDVDVAMIHNPRQNEQEFVQSICDELGVDYAKHDVTLKTLVDALNQHLLATHAAKRRTVLIIDEAQQLRPEVLEQVRLLTNLETHKEKLLRIMLVGQPELATLLARPDLRQLAQRITARYHLMPLEESETREYITHRLRVAGCPFELFQADALREVHRRANGIPRLINIICDRALLGAYSKGLRSISTDMVKQAAQEAIEIEIPVLTHNDSARWMLWLERAELVFAPLAIILVCVLAYQALRSPKPVQVPVTAVAAVAAITSTATPAVTLPPAKPANPLQAAQPLPVVINRLIKLWLPNFRMTGIENICRTLRDQKLECFKDDGDWTELTALNRPAILTLQSADGAEHHVLLRELSASEAVLDTANGPQKFPRATLTPLWTGEYLLLWPRQVDTSNIGPNSRGESVQWLRRRLAEATGKKINVDSPRFDNALRDEIVNFQARHRLEKTGAAGPRTLIALGDGRKDAPTLAGNRP